MSNTVEVVKAKVALPWVSLEGSEKFYKLDEQELEFFRMGTGIHDEAALKEHMVRVQREAYAIHAFPCIRMFSFTRLKLARLPGYEKILVLGRTREYPIFLDIGCCFGNDVRKLVADGYPIDSVMATDLHPEFLELGHKLFNTTPSTYPVPFLAGDALDPSFLEVVHPFYTKPYSPRPNLSELTSLSALHGHVSAISVCSVFHVFDEAGQLQLARAIAGLLSPEPGSMVIGIHSGRPEKGTFVTHAGGRSVSTFYHSPESWTQLWDGELFVKGTVRVQTELIETGGWDFQDSEADRYWFLVWSVTRL
ncbi:hypothetical protein L226DRAFT_575992 [Lentinus tigrinus ALCF2SS1-7]|uniref:Methyltransferase domain-containing protein n=1 Tax=Lentinus tigrinus ALCF2SS1-6 TaxID=1328759 RepID=A0A5C2S6D7_9APHY|nr:hypothetical protein L227DRAFT_504537 [Lentinus tigrinus ALCF2SS1-6]RPD68920.1 hypothetical protein L226DRAFT_575992 [Lentinus tigrinus ALCF2SS1-7]